MALLEAGGRRVARVVGTVISVLVAVAMTVMADWALSSGGIITGLWVLTVLIGVAAAAVVGANVVMRKGEFARAEGLAGTGRIIAVSASVFLLGVGFMALIATEDALTGFLMAWLVFTGALGVIMNAWLTAVDARQLAAATPAH